MNDDIEIHIKEGIESLRTSINFIYSITPRKREFLLAMVDGFEKQLNMEVNEK